MSMSYGKFIEHHRLINGFKSQRRLAEKSGISSATISRVEAEVQKPEPETLKLLSKHLKTTSFVELMVVCGYWDEEELLTPIDYDINPKNNISALKESSPSYANEKEFVNNIDLSDEELLERFKLTVDGRELSDQEAKNIVAFVRTLRQNN